MPEPTELDTVVSDIEALADALASLPSSSRLAHADADKVYSLAYHFLEQGHFQTALQYFSLLCYYQPTHTDYLTGAAICNRMLENYSEALKIYSFLAVVYPDNAQHTLAIAECLMLQRDVQEARETVDRVLRYCRENPTPSQTKLNEKAQALSEMLVLAEANA